MSCLEANAVADNCAEFVLYGIIFDGTRVNVCSDGQRYLGSAIGSSDFVNKFVWAQVQSWCDELSLLTDIARSQPHAVFLLYIHGFACKWTFLYAELLLPFCNSLNHWTITY